MVAPVSYRQMCPSWLLTNTLPWPSPDGIKYPWSCNGIWSIFNVTRDTPPAPSNFYGDSKLQAEFKLRPLSSGSFKVAILRCPMIYGKGSKGNFPILEKMAAKCG